MGTTTKGKLTFIGLGLYDASDLSLKAQKTMHSCDLLFAEFYTSILMGDSIKSLERIAKKPITILTRQQTEKGDILINAAQQHHIGFLTGGDSMTATTHVDLRLRAIREGIETHVVHGSTIISAAPGLLGLQHYKFGRITTLVYPEKNYFPMSPYDIIYQNNSHGLHSLILLDIQTDRQRFMTANEGIQLLLEMEKKQRKQLIQNDTLLCVVGQVGSDRPTVRADSLSKLETEDFGLPLHTLILPGKLHFMELEAMEILAGLPSKLSKKIQKI